MGGEQTRKIRDKLATISIPYEGENNPIVFSYHYKYEKYLRDNNLVDVSRISEKNKTLLMFFNIYLNLPFLTQPEKAKIMQEKLKRKQQLTKDKDSTTKKRKKKGKKDDKDCKNSSDSQ